jgi:NhaP-type Na+/H+ or K+/H+ antiporter
MTRKNIVSGYTVCNRFVLAAVSPAVVVPSMLSLHEQGYGMAKGIPTLVIAAASVDDVLAISGFGVALGIAFSKGASLRY